MSTFRILLCYVGVYFPVKKNQNNRFCNKAQNTYAYNLIIKFQTFQILMPLVCVCCEWYFTMQSGLDINFFTKSSQKEK